jgi:hypothetical protein
VISLFMGYPFAGAEMRIRLGGGQIGAALSPTGARRSAS